MPRCADRRSGSSRRRALLRARCIPLRAPTRERGRNRGTTIAALRYADAVSNPFLRILTGFGEPRPVVEAVEPQRTFADVILPPDTRRQLDHALVQVTRHDLIFNRWGLRERHPTSLALAFNFAGAPG